MEEKKNKNNSKINRRDFFKLAGAGTLASAAALYGCSDKNNRSDSESAALGEIPTDKMVYRTNPTTGDRVSLLGYGCMRWPTRKRADGNGDEVDQEAVNELIDYAIAHGVNYFDTSPVYVQGWSEKSTGIALKRHPREKFLIATKLSNFSNYTRENSIAMYRKSFEDLQVDYIDYYLLHSVGNGGIKTFRARYIDNGMIDFLMEERKAGRIRNLGFSFHGTTDVFDEILAMHDRIHWDFVQIQLNYADWRHASGNNVNAEYLYGELVKRDIPAIIMEPLLGGRLSRLNDHLVARLKQHRPQESVASWAFRFAGSFPKVLTVLSGMTYMEHLQDNLRTYSPLDPCTEEELALLEDTAQVSLPILSSRATTASIACLVPTDWTFPPFCCITTAASTRAIYPKAAGMRTIAKPAAPSSSVMTVAYRSSARQAIVQDATNATRTVLKASIYPKSYRK